MRTPNEFETEVAGRYTVYDDEPTTKTESRAELFKDIPKEQSGPVIASLTDIEANYRAASPTSTSFTGADTIVGINGKVIKDVYGIQVHKKYNLSNENFCATIPELNISDLDSIKNLDGVVIIDSVINDSELDVPEGATIQLGFANEYGFKLRKEIKDCHIIKRSLVVSVDCITVMEQIILVAGSVGPIQKFTDEVDA